MKLSVAALLATFAMATLTAQANPVPAEAEVRSSSGTIEARACCQMWGCGPDGNRCCSWSSCN
ncbi:hypothetical protein K7432_017684 [Basidiobolus ranarum]|uniref:Uncharacterized protein n=1 Tax=Basidiobolus ranarum TaxID=34480 RepID=A0ABR2WD18_9FUNG